MPEFDYEDIIAQYNVVATLGQGGQKIVFAVDHPQYGSCVLKIGAFKSQMSLERVIREVETLRAISSQYYPKEFAFQVVDSHRFYILEERIDGQPLSSQMNRFSSASAATKLVIQIVNGLMLLWERRIVHRDVKPANIIITPTGNPRIIDLGIARLLDLASLTHSLAPFGPCTPNYASPEQLQNRKHEINHRADQFCVGTIYGQLLLRGSHPFDPSVVGDGQSIPENIINGRWARHRLEPPDLAPIVPVLSKMLV
jgi:serine/threonine protein kinase